MLCCPHLPGGRTWTDTSLGFPADFGASWVHGASAQNPLTAVVQALHLRTEDHPDQQRCRPSGPSEAGRVFLDNEIWNFLEGICLDSSRFIQKFGS